VTAALQASGLGKRYRRTWALKDCNLTVPSGRIAALVGPNGAGKTTLLHLAVGLLAPTTGSIGVLDRVPGDPELASQVGFVVQDIPLYREFLQALMGSVAEQGVTVVLSSHLLADLERVCDYLIVLSSARVQVLGPVEKLLDRHKLLIGPYRPDQPPVAGVAQVVRASHTDRQATLLVRTNGPIHDPAWKAHEVTRSGPPLPGAGRAVRQPLREPWRGRHPAVVPAAVRGAVLGAPLVAREVEHGTYRLVWTQGVSRRRWALAKFGLVGGGVVLAAACYALLVTWWRAPLDQATGDRFLSLGGSFDLEGLVPVGYAVFAVALGWVPGP
jgi:hypothetical protein